MKLEKIITDPAQALQYMERLVNNGSPSKFTFENMARKEYNPFFRIALIFVTRQELQMILLYGGMNTLKF